MSTAFAIGCLTVSLVLLGYAVREWRIATAECE